MAKHCALFIILCFLFIDANAECLVNGTVYLNHHSKYNASNNRIYLNTNQINSNCGWTPTTGPTCFICSTSYNGGGQCNGPGAFEIQGIENASFTMVECPIDENYALLGFGLLISVISIRKINSKHKKAAIL